MKAPVLQRTQGAADVALIQGRPQRLAQQGSAKAIVLAGAVPEVVFLNTAGGLTGGDRLSYALSSDGPTLATTQTAERAYRSLSGNAEVTVDLTIGAGRLDWLPQETILFDGSALRRRTRITLAPEAECLILECVVLGRAAMGETLHRFAFDDRREVWRAARPLLIESLRLDAGDLHGPAALAGARAFASLSLIARGAADALGAVRAALSSDEVTSAASALDGRLSLRFLAPDGWPLRRQLARVLSLLRPAGLPRVWQMTEAEP